VVPDATRQTASGRIVNLLIRRLISQGVAPFDIRIIFATGIHRPVTNEEKDILLTPFITQRIKALDHNARDIASIVRLGETTGGIPIEVNQALKQHDHVILIGGVTFHYFAGFTGGRKLVCPGLASARTINSTHKLAFDCDKKTRRHGIGPGLVDGNAVHEAFVEVVQAIQPSYAISTIVDSSGQVADLYCGHWKTSHRKACEIYSTRHQITFVEKRPLVVASCGGFPYDVNMIQAHKTLDAASKACTDGGTIVLLAECSDGLGRSDFLNWFEASDSEELADRLCVRYQVNGQTAWSLLTKSERFEVRIITSLDQDTAAKMRLKKVLDLKSLPSGKGYIMPDGAKYLFQEKKSSPIA
jgi:nickel-dependent lactate racemase